MGNRQKPKRPDLIIKQSAVDAGKINLPPQEKVVLKEVPAVIHWGQIPGSERQDDEIIGKAIMYEDGTSDIITGEMSPEAQKMLYSFLPDKFSIGEE